MSVLVLYYSRSGNNRLLAQHLAARLGADVEEVRAAGWRTFLSVILDMSRDRRPRLHPLRRDVGMYDTVLFLAPIWDLAIAHPMKTCLENVKAALKSYSFVTLCGYRREGQGEHIRKELTALTGREPAHTAELLVADLVPEGDRQKVRVVSAKRVTEAELGRFGLQIEAILGWFGTQPAATDRVSEGLRERARDTAPRR